MLVLNISITKLGDDLCSKQKLERITNYREIEREKETLGVREREKERNIMSERER